MLSTFLSSLIGKLAIGAVALATTTGGLATTGNLPDQAQDWASQQLSQIGIEIPASDDTGRVDSDVLDVIREGNPEDGEEFGQDVADTASDSKSSDGLDRADDGKDNARADLPDEADQGANNADTEEADNGGDNAGIADDYRP